METLNLKSYHKWRWRFVAIWIVAFTGVSYYAIHSNRSLTNELKTQRRDGLILSCRDQNRHHDSTVTYVNAQKAPEQEKKTFLHIVDLLAPKYDCIKRVEVLTR